MFNKFRQFFVERAKWIKVGKPYRINNRIKELFNICNSCDMYKKKNESEGSCSVCGCRLTLKKELLNKLAWATTRCPLENPKWIEEEAFQNLEVTEQEIQIEEKLKQEETKKEEQQKSVAPIPVKKKKNCGCGGGKKKG